LNQRHRFLVQQRSSPTPSPTFGSKSSKFQTPRLAEETRPQLQRSYGIGTIVDHLLTHDGRLESSSTRESSLESETAFATYPLTIGRDREGSIVGRSSDNADDVNKTKESMENQGSSGCGTGNTS
jgi:hypothetical protein